MRSAEEKSGRMSASCERRRPLRVFIPFTSTALARAALNSVSVLGGDLDVEPVLVAVHVVPYPLPLDRPDVPRVHLMRQLKSVASSATVGARVRLAMGRDPESVLRAMLPPSSLVLLVSRRRWWRTREERLASVLKREGHVVVLLKSHPQNGGITIAPATERVMQGGTGNA